MSTLSSGVSKSTRVKRVLEKRAAKIVENPKTCLFLKGRRASVLVQTALKDLYALKKPYGILYQKKNDVLPFEDASVLEKFGQKNDSSLFLLGSSNKKRPHSMILGRLFDHQILDMVELVLTHVSGMSEIKGKKSLVGSKPCMLFNGDVFDREDTYIRLKNLFLDFFRGQQVSEIDLQGLDHVISVSACQNEEGLVMVYFRVYTISFKKSGTRLPRVELEEMGPSFDFTVNRTRFASEELARKAYRVPRQIRPKKVKNVERNELGDKVGRVHVNRQDLSELQTRKRKALRPVASDKQPQVAE